VSCGTDNVADLATALSHAPLVRRPEQGAPVLVRLATDPAFATRTGAFISRTPPAGLLPTIPAVRDVARRRELWAVTEALLNAT